MKTCGLYVIREFKQTIAGHVFLDGAKITSKAEPGYERLMDNVMANPVVIDGGERQVTAKEKPEEWFAALPANYSGSYFRARIMD
jgi:hypothetical protein